MDERKAAMNRRTPRLLVSVRDAGEAEAAIAGGCDILDVKEPTRGPLGMASLADIEAIVAIRDRLAPSMSVSVALGEARDWDVPVPGPRSPVPLLPPGIAFAKLGTAGLASVDEWKEELEAARRGWAARIRTEDQSGSIRWIAVAYADWAPAEAPAPREIVVAAALGGWQGVLVDTCAKGGRRLWDWLSADDLAGLAADCRQAGLQFALAGRLRLEDLSRLRDISPDIVGVRTAACEGGNREGRVDPTAVSRLRAGLTGTGRVGVSP